MVSNYGKLKDKDVFKYDNRKESQNATCSNPAHDPSHEPYRELQLHER